MELGLLAAALSPVLAALFYIYIRDKYEKEPWRLLAVGTAVGVVITYPIIQTENAILGRMPIMGVIGEAAYSGFIVAAFTETAFKCVLLYLLTWDNPNLNEPFDGIVYAVFIALGFAGLENVLYVLSPIWGGLGTAFIRAVLSIPAHGFFAVTTGYYFAMARFVADNRRKYLLKAFFATWLIHGTYDFILMSGKPVLLAAFVPFMVWMWVGGLKRIRAHIEVSPFKNMLKK